MDFSQVLSLGKWFLKLTVNVSYPRDVGKKLKVICPKFKGKMEGCILESILLSPDGPNKMNRFLWRFLGQAKILYCKVQHVGGHSKDL